MFILKRQNVEIIQIQDPQNKEQKIGILQYQGQSFRLLSAFGDRRDEALSFWRDLTDNKGKVCVLLEEPSRFSVWGKIKIDQYQPEKTVNLLDRFVERSLVQGCLLMLQAVYVEIEDLFGIRQAISFKQDLLKALQKGKFPQVETVEALEQLFNVDPLTNLQIPSWDDDKLQVLLGELYKLALAYLGNTTFRDTAKEALENMPPSGQAKVLNWIKNSPQGYLWQ